MMEEEFREEHAQRRVEYETLSEEYWSVERFDLLARDFGLEPGDLAEWHQVFGGKGRVWDIVIRLYQIGSLLLPDPEILREWSRKDVAKKFGIPAAQVDAELEGAVKHWKLTHARQELVREAGQVLGTDEIDQLTSFASGDDIEVETVEKLLEAFNFREVKDAMLRVTVAKRILSLKDYLASPHTRTAAREIIRFEITMHGLEKILTSYNNKIEELTKRDPTRASTASEVDSLAEKAQKLDAEIRKIGAAHSKLQKDIGADDIDMTTRKRIFVETVAYIQEKCREYESDPANVLMDGVFRAGEIDWLMEPLGERKAQYRPDIVTRLRDALLPENLWNPEYHPPKIAIRVCQELTKLVEGMRTVPEDGPPLNEMDEDDDAVGMAEGVDVPLADEAEAAVPVATGGYFGRREESDGEIMGVY